MQIEQTQVIVSTPDGQMPAFVCKPSMTVPQAGVVLLMEAFGLTQHIQDVAVQIAKEGYIVIAPDLYYREPNNKFTYEEVEQARAMMFRLDFEKSVDEDIRAAITYVKSKLDVPTIKVGVTGFCLGGGLAFLSACKLSDEIAAAAPFYGVVLDEWIDAAITINVPMYLFFGGVDPFIPLQRVEQMKSRLQELGKEFQLKIYNDADHGFFCHERSSYNYEAAEDSWHELVYFFRQHLQ